MIPNTICHANEPQKMVLESSISHEIFKMVSVTLFILNHDGRYFATQLNIGNTK
jgi:hypothetical protein